VFFDVTGEHRFDDLFDRHLAALLVQTASRHLTLVEFQQAAQDSL